jgi:putative acetyltransferase
MKVRPYSSPDLDQVMSVYHDAVHVLAAPFYSQPQLAAWAPADSNPDRWRERLSRVQTIVMDADGIIAGFASYEMSGHLDLLFTRPEFARRGVARQLYAATERALTEADTGKVFTEASLAARAFFESQGFKVLQEETVDCCGVELKRYAMDKEIRAP